MHAEADLGDDTERALRPQDEGDDCVAVSADCVKAAHDAGATAPGNDGETMVGAHADSRRYCGGVVRDDDDVGSLAGVAATATDDVGVRLSAGVPGTRLRVVAHGVGTDCGD